MRRKISRARASRFVAAPGSDNIFSFGTVTAIKWPLGRSGASRPPPIGAGLNKVRSGAIGLGWLLLRRVARNPPPKGLKRGLPMNAAATEFVWDDPLNLEAQLGEDERLI